MREEAALSRKQGKQPVPEQPDRNDCNTGHDGKLEHVKEGRAHDGCHIYDRVFPQEDEEEDHVDQARHGQGKRNARPAKTPGKQERQQHIDGKVNEPCDRRAFRVLLCIEGGGYDAVHRNEQQARNVEAEDFLRHADGLGVKAAALEYERDDALFHYQREKSNGNCDERNDFDGEGQHAAEGVPLFFLGESRQVRQNQGADGHGADAEDELLQAERILDGRIDPLPRPRRKGGRNNIVELVGSHADDGWPDEAEDRPGAGVGKGLPQRDERKPPAAAEHEGQLKGCLYRTAGNDTDRHRTGGICHPWGKQVGQGDDNRVEQDGRKARRRKELVSVQNALKEGGNRNDDKVGKHNAGQHDGLAQSPRTFVREKNPQYEGGKDHSDAYQGCRQKADERKGRIDELLCRCPALSSGLFCPGSFPLPVRLFLNDEVLFKRRYEGDRNGVFREEAAAEVGNLKGNAERIPQG